MKTNNSWPARMARRTANEALTLKIFLNFFGSSENVFEHRLKALTMLSAHFSPMQGVSVLKPPKESIRLERSFLVVFSNSPQGLEALQGLFKTRRLVVDGKVFEVCRFAPAKASQIRTEPLARRDAKQPAAPAASRPLPPSAPPKKRNAWFPPADQKANTKEDSIPKLRHDLNLALKRIEELNRALSAFSKISESASSPTAPSGPTASTGATTPAVSNNLSATLNSSYAEATSNNNNEKSASSPTAPSGPTASTGATIPAVSNNLSATLNSSYAEAASNNNNEKSASSLLPKRESSTATSLQPSAKKAKPSALGTPTLVRPPVTDASQVAPTAPVISAPVTPSSLPAPNTAFTVPVVIKINPSFGALVRALEVAPIAPAMRKSTLEQAIANAHFPPILGDITILGNQASFRSPLSEKVLQIDLAHAKVWLAGKACSIALHNTTDGTAWLLETRFPASDDDGKRLAEALLRGCHHYQKENTATVRQIAQNCAPASAKLNPILRQAGNEI